MRPLLLAFALSCGLAVAPSQAADRVALVIGNGKYVNATALPNPANDAQAVARALGEIGFDVAQGTDLDRNAMERLLRDFLRKAVAARVALLFYAGHGMQVDGRNYLVPVDAKLEAASDLGFETVELDKILASLDDPSRATIVILDACRDNPLARSFSMRLGATRSAAVGAGLAAYSTLGTGTLIAFATAPGQVALDGQSTNSPFTEGLVKHLRTPGLEVRQMLTRVRADVAASTRNRQIPWDNSSLLGEVYLAGSPKDGAQIAATGVAPPPAPLPPLIQPPPVQPTPPVARLVPPGAPGSGFIFADSHQRLLTRDELSRLPLDQLRLARNEIYARRGRFFRDSALAAHFSKFPWYKPHAWEVPLGAIEQANVKLIQSMER
jgi:caspase domain-containing protein/YARHG domain-containing protein